MPDEDLMTVQDPMTVEKLVTVNDLVLVEDAMIGFVCRLGLGIFLPVDSKYFRRIKSNQFGLIFQSKGFH